MDTYKQKNNEMGNSLPNLPEAELEREEKQRSILFEVGQAITRGGLEQVLTVVASGFKNLNLPYLIAAVDTVSRELVIQQISIDSRALQLAEKWSGKSFLGYRFEESFWKAQQVFKQDEHFSNHNPLKLLADFFPAIPKPMLEQILKITGVKQDDTILFFVIKLKQNVVGLLVVWGNQSIAEHIPFLSTLAPILGCVMEVERLQVEVQKNLLGDELTGLYNRQGFFMMAEHLARTLQRTNNPALILVLDLDGLKQINEQYGHREGDQALADFAQVLKKTFRSSDLLARIDGDTFAVFATESTESDSAILTNRFEQNLRKENTRNGRKFELSACIGIVTWRPGYSTSIESLYNQAEDLMRVQKSSRG
jgi:diguanylate cyclase (GGDEF)-like protein